MYVDQLLEGYFKLTEDCLINQLDTNMVYYYGDKVKSGIYTYNSIWEIDIKSAFPTICKMLYGNDFWFVKEIDKIDTKFEKNKYIATTLTYNKSPDLKYKIKDINVWCKIVILGLAHCLFIDPFILELKKDGLLLVSNGKVQNFSQIQRQFIDILDLYEFEIHMNQFDQYMRCNKTSYYISGDNIDIKGQFKNPPVYIKKLIYDLFFTNLVSDINQLNSIKQKYSQLYFDIITRKGLYSVIEYIYSFDGNKYILSDGKLQCIKSIYTIKNKVCPLIYLYNYIYPLISTVKSIYD